MVFRAYVPIFLVLVSLTLPNVNYVQSSRDADERTEAAAVEPDIAKYSRTYVSQTIGDILKRFTKFTHKNPPPLNSSKGGYLGVVLMLEMFTKAAGYHFILPQDEDRNVTVHLRAKAYAFTNLWLQVEHSQAADRLLTRVVRRLVYQHMQLGRRLNYQRLYSLFEMFLEQLQSAVAQEDSGMATVYEDGRKESLRRVGFPVGFSGIYPDEKTFLYFKDLKRGMVDYKAVDEWLDDLDMREALIHHQFLGEAMKAETANDTEDDVSVRLVFDVAAELCCAKNDVQKVYSAALERVAENFEPEEFPLGTVRALIDDIISTMERDDELRPTWQSTRGDKLAQFRKLRGRRGRSLWTMKTTALFQRNLFGPPDEGSGLLPPSHNQTGKA